MSGFQNLSKFLERSFCLIISKSIEKFLEALIKQSHIEDDFIIINDPEFNHLVFRNRIKQPDQTYKGVSVRFSYWYCPKNCFIIFNAKLYEIKEMVDKTIGEIHDIRVEYEELEQSWKEYNMFNPFEQDALQKNIIRLAKKSVQLLPRSI